MAKHTPVLFNDSAGNIITNDPIYKAQQLLASVEDEQPEGTLAANAGPPEDSGDSDSDQNSDGDDESPTDADGDEEDGLDELTGPELKELAKERDVDISGLKKVSQVRQALRDAAAKE